MPLGATPHHPSRVHRAKALAARGRRRGARCPPPRLATSLLYAPGDRRLARLERLALLPAVPLTGRGAARTQPLWAEDAADGVVAALDRAATATRATSSPARRCSPTARSSRSCCAPPAAAAGSCRPARRPARRPAAGEMLAGPTAFATWDEALMLAVPMLAARGPADAEALGVRPRRMADGARRVEGA